jgi:DNA-binding NtrC family response regulator
MGQARAHRPIALVVEDDASQRVLVTTLLEESKMSVIQCESAEAAEIVMDKIGRVVALLFTDVRLAGNMSGLELADKAKARYPEMTVIITSGRDCPSVPKDTRFLPKPWNALDILMEAEKTLANGYH